MDNKIQDKETTELKRVGNDLKSLVESSGWSIARERLMKRVAQMLNLMSISNPNKEAIVQEIAARQLAASYIIDWIKDIEGTVHQTTSNDIKEEIKDEYIVRL